MSVAMAKRESADAATSDPQLDAIKRVLSQQTPQSEIRVRLGRGGMQLKYTDGAYVIRTLNAAFGWDWDFVADSEELLMNNGQPFEVKVRGTLTVRLGGRAVVKTQYGSQPIEMLKNGSAPVSIGDCYKGAATDAMKKCASLLGIALDLYDSDYRADKYADSEPVESEPDIDTAILRGKAPEPVRPVKLEGAQPTRKPSSNKRHSILAYAEDVLKWTPEQLIAEIDQRFKIAINPANLNAALESLSTLQLKELDQVLKAEFANHNRTR